MIVSPRGSNSNTNFSTRSSSDRAPLYTRTADSRATFSFGPCYCLVRKLSRSLQGGTRGQVHNSC